MARTQKAHSYMTYCLYKKKKKKKNYYLFFYIDSKYDISNTDLIDMFSSFVEGEKC